MAEKQQTAKSQAAKPQTRAAARDAVAVEIYDQTYQLSGTDAAHIERLAALVDGKMRAVWCAWCDGGLAAGSGAGGAEHRR